MQIYVYCVIELFDNQLLSVKTFENSGTGYSAALTVYNSCIRKNCNNDFSSINWTIVYTDMEYHNGDYTVYLISSET